MKLSLYSRLARSGMRNNRQLYLPYLLTCICMVMMYYIISALSVSDMVAQMRGGDVMGMILTLGRFVIAIFAAIFLLYTNSFLIRRRNREFGLYNILGMNKRNIAVVVIIESFYVYLISVVLGLALGILFSKLCELVLVNIVSAEIDYSLHIDLRCVLSSFAYFAAVFLITLLVNLLRIRISDPISLLKSSNAGEKAPKSNLFIALAGLVLLGNAYYIAVTIQTPFDAIAFFFVAVIIVILATYLLFISGSVTLCRLLQKNKAYYYRPSHFVSVSSMVYRMKRNGAGLASICILSTMVLVMLSSTSCLYFGVKDAVRTQYPYDYILTYHLSSSDLWGSEELSSAISDTEAAISAPVTETLPAVFSETFGIFDKNGDLNIDPDADIDGSLSLDGLRYVLIIPMDEYRAFTGLDTEIADNEVLIYSYSRDYPYASFSIMGGESRTPVITHDFDVLFPNSYSGLTDGYLCFVNNYAEYSSPLEQYVSLRELQLVTPYLIYCFNTSVPDAEKLDFDFKPISNVCAAHPDSLSSYSYSCHEESLQNFYSLHGSLFFLGILLSVVFIMAAVLIIYYKQISEGYEDVSRFEIMQKLGMTKKEVRASINSQVLTVFFAPLLMAGLHLCFAFPIVFKMLVLFGVSNKALFLEVNLVCFAVFALFYAIVYKCTEDTYFKIVCGAEE